MAGGPGTGSNRRTHYGRKVNRVGSSSSQLADGFNEFAEVKRTLFKANVGSDFLWNIIIGE
jgi:hypothetical protein